MLNLGVFQNCPNVRSCNNKNDSALDDMSMVERREFFEPEPDEYRLDDEERHSRFDFGPIKVDGVYFSKININQIILNARKETSHFRRL